MNPEIPSVLHIHISSSSVAGTVGPFEVAVPRSSVSLTSLLSDHMHITKNTVNGCITSYFI